MRRPAPPQAGFVLQNERNRPMLVLSRKKNEKIEIDGGIEITVVDIGGDKVRLGIEAPKEITILREEVALAIARQKEVAA